MALAFTFGRILHDLRIAPHHVYAVTERLMIALEVARQYADDIETVAQLKRQNRVTLLLLLHLFDIVLDRTEFLHTFGQGWQTPSKHDALQPEFLTQGLALIVQTLAYSITAVIRVDTDLHAVQPITLGIMVRAIALPRDLYPGMRSERNLFGYQEGRAVTHDHVIDRGDELASRVIVDLAGHHALVVGLDTGIAIDFFCQCSDRRSVFSGCLAYHQAALRIL